MANKSKKLGDPDEQLREGILILERQQTEGADAEGVGPDLEQLAHAGTSLESAASAFGAQNREEDTARALLHRARAVSLLRPTVENRREIEASLRQALAALDTTRHAREVLQGYVVLAKVVKDLAFLQPIEREDHLARALHLLEAAQVIAAQVAEPAQTAELGAATATILGERFLENRDENLLDSIAFAEQAFRFFRGNPNGRQRDHGALLNYAGGCYLRLRMALGRRECIERARSLYAEALEVVQAEKCPKLHGILSGNLARCDQLLETGDEGLPETEMVSRFGSEIAAGVNTEDFDGALQCAWAFLQWAWTLPAKPNAHMGAAHISLGRLYARMKQNGMAEENLYCALAVLLPTVKPGAPWFDLVEQARHSAEEFLQMQDRSAHLTPLLEQASQALARAVAHFEKGLQLLPKNEAEASVELDTALGLFPCFPDALYHRGTIYLKQGNVPTALGAFNKALSLLPRHEPSLVYRAYIRAQTGEFEAALEDYNTVLEGNAEHAGARFNRAQTYLRLGKNEEAVADLDKVISAEPDFPGARQLRDALAQSQTASQH